MESRERQRPEKGQMLDTLSWHVMNSTADDWESLKQILPQVREFCGLVEESRVAEVIAQLIAEVFMEEMQGRQVRPEQVLGDPIEFWFRMTLKGRAIWEIAGGKYQGEMP